jgi:predicted dehydrogenase
MAVRGLPKGTDDRMTRPTAWAILGTGVVSRKFALGLGALGGRTSVGAVASRDPANAEAFVRSLGMGRAVATYEEAIADPSIDAVYIATPPAMHEPHALLAFAAGKPALIEKPLAQDAAAAARIADAASAAGVFAMEAMWTRFLPLIAAVKDRIERGGIGEVRGFHGTFLGANLPDAGTSLFAPGGGGALLHRGVYPLSLARHLLGPVVDVTARGRIGETGVDEEVVLTLVHASGALSDVRASIRTAGTNDCAVWGTRGRIEIDGPVWRPSAARLVTVTPSPVTRPVPRRFEAFRESSVGQRLAERAAMMRGILSGRASSLPGPVLGNGYAHEAAHLMDCVADGRLVSDIMPLTQSVEILDIVDRALVQVREAG